MVFCKAGVTDEVARESKSLDVSKMLLVGRIETVEVLCGDMKVVVNFEDVLVDSNGEGAAVVVVEKVLITFVVVDTMLGSCGDDESIVDVPTTYIIGR